MFVENALKELETDIKSSKTTSGLAVMFGNASELESVLKQFTTDIEKFAKANETWVKIVTNINQAHLKLVEISALANKATESATPTAAPNNTAKTTPDVKEESEIVKKTKAFTDSVTTELGKAQKIIDDDVSLLEKMKEDLSQKIKGAEGKNNSFGLDDAKFKTTDTAKVTGSDKRLDVDATKAKLALVKKDLDEYNANLDKAQKKSDLFFDAELIKYLKDSDEYKVLEQAKGDFANQMSLKRQEAEKKESDLLKASFEIKTGLLVQTLDQINAIWNDYKGNLDSGIAQYKAYMTESAKQYKEQADEVKKEITAIDAKLTESISKRKSLEDEAANASGGRTLVVQEQLAREMAANDELTTQKKELAKEEERLRKDAAAREKRAKRAEILASIPKAIVDVAAGVSKALSMGLLGIPIAVLIGIQGALQVATIKKQLENFEDGGLLRGKRHKQGGMQIEGTNIEVEGDEYVVNRISTQKNLGLIDYINRQRRQLNPDDISRYYSRRGGVQPQQHSMKRMFDEGGQLTNLEVVSAASAPDGNKVLEAISRINFRPVVSVVDIATAQTNVVQVKDIAGV